MKNRSFIFRTGQCPSNIRSVTAGLAFAAVFATAPIAHAQLTTADIVGTVTDATGSVVPNAQVQIKNLGTNETRTTATSAGGDYTVTNLQPGHYSVTIKADGFKAVNVKDLAIEAGDRARSDAHMELGSVSEVVNVEASTPLLQADNATVSSTVTSQSVQDLPLNGRNYVQLVQLVPGANEGPGNGLTSGGRPDDRRQTSSFSVNGQDDTLNNFVIDGFDNNERVIGTSGVRPNVEGIQEISVQTNSYAPEAGRTAGGVVNITTRSGTNSFHGSAYEYFRNDVFDARQVLQTTGSKPELRQNQFGGSIGGPIFKDKTFFYGDYEGFRQVQGVTYQETVPTLAEYNNINSLNGGSPQALVNMGQSGQSAYPINNIALNYLKLFPAPTNSQLTNNYVSSPNRTQYSNVFDVRIDHRFNANNLFFGRYTYNKVDTVTPPALGTRNGLQISGGQYIFAGPATDSAQQYAFDYTHIFNERLLLDLKAGFTRINNLSLPLNYGANADTQVGFGPNMNFNANSNSLTPITFGPFSDIGDGSYVPLNDIDNTFQYAGILSWTRGNHNIKTGVSYIRRQARNLQSAFAAGQYTFSLAGDSNADQLTQQNNQLASALVGAFSNQTRQYNLNTPNYRTFEPSAFIQDNWKVRPNLTLIYGVRYDIFTPFTEAHGYISNFDYKQALASTPATVGQALKVPGVNGVSATAGIKTDYTNVAPRVGFSYSANPGTVFRGGFGMSYFPGNYTSNADLKNAPWISVYSPSCVSDIGAQLNINHGGLSGSNTTACSSIGAVGSFSQGLPLPAAQTINSTGLTFSAEDPNFRSALMYQYNFQMEEQFGANVLTIGYVGNQGQHLPQTLNSVNSPAPLDTATINPVTKLPYNAAVRPLGAILPNLSGVGLMLSEGVSKYNALQTSFQRRFTHGIAFDANYTWGKGMNDVTGFSQEGSQGAYNTDINHIRQIDYGVAENNIANRFALSLNYQFAAGHEFHGLSKAAFGGWQANVIAVWQSGKPFTILNSGSGIDGPYGNRAVPNLSAGNDRPNVIANPFVGANKGVGPNNHFFNPAAFVPQPLGTIGNVIRNVYSGPQFRHVDLSLFKDFSLTEKYKVQFRAESFNMSNTPNWYLAQGSGNVELGNSAFGTVTAVDSNYNPRLIQFALKFNF